jgi:hypothetical protein
LVVAILLSGAGWYYSEVLRSDGLAVSHAHTADLQISAVTSETVTLLASEDAAIDGPWTQAGIWGLEWDGGYAQVGAITVRGDHSATRQLLRRWGDPPPGAAARLDSFAFPGDPTTSFGIPYRDVAYSAPIGNLSAWRVGEPAATWAILVHGKNSELREALRILPSLTNAGVTSMVISYRNDEWAPSTADGYAREVSAFVQRLGE